jgi:enolase-phosphatase E1
MTLRVILLDVEGTTIPISFVYNKLFPYARSHIPTWLREHHRDPEVHSALVDLEKENFSFWAQLALQFRS